VSAVGSYGGSTASLDYAYIRESPASGVFRLREELTAAASVEFVDNWSALGSLTYDLQADARVGHALGLSYADECFAISAVYSETTDPYSDLASQREIFLRISLRNLGDSTFSSQLSDDYPATEGIP
jgi:LPS-assembly protein